MKNELTPVQNRFHENGHAGNQSTQVQAHTTAHQPELLAYDIQQAAFALNVCPKTIRRLLARGKLTSCKVLRKILIPREQIENFLNATCDKPNLGV